MKTTISVLRFFLLSGLLCSPVCFAQETPSGSSQRTTDLATMIAPLIDDQVVLIVHINPKEFDFDLILDKTILYVENALRSVNLPPGQTLDARVLTTVRTNVQVQFEHMFRDFREIRDRMIQEAGIDDIFLLIYRDMVPYVPFVLVSPLNDRTADERRAFARIVRGAFPILFSERDFMVCSAPYQMNQREEADVKLRGKLKELQNSLIANISKHSEAIYGDYSKIPHYTNNLITILDRLFNIHS